MSPRVSKPLFRVMTALALIFGIRLTQYISLEPDMFEPELRRRYIEYLSIVAFHAAAGCTALLLGPLLLSETVRRRAPRFHRIAGRISFLAIILGSLTGAFMAGRAFGGTIPQTAFFVQSISWLVTAALGVKRAKERRLAAHKAWMIRNYALTFAAVSLRVELSACQIAGLQYLSAYQIVSWSSWLLNLAAAEAIIRFHVSGGRRRRGSSGAQPAYGL